MTDGMCRRCIAEGEASQPPPRRPGPGTHLKSLLARWLGFTAAPGCKCNAMARKMDRMGPGWCESDAGMVEILGVMRDEHAKRRARGKTLIPWVDAGARQVVLLACRLARD